MHFMIIERFKDAEAVAAVYERFADRGRLMPDGLKYVSSWVEANFDRCFLVAECEDVRLIQQWVLQWNDLIEFDVVPVATSKETAEVVALSRLPRAAKGRGSQSRTSRSRTSRPKPRAP